MPKLPRQETKHSATPARSGGAISGSTMCATRERPGAGGARRLDQFLRQSAQSRAHGQEHERRVLHAEHQHDAVRRVKRIALPDRRRDAQHLQQRARRPEELQPGQRHDLRREHQRQHEAEHERVAPADIGQGHSERDDRAERDGDRGPAKRGHETMPRRRPGRRIGKTREGVRRQAPCGATASSSSRASGSTERTSTTATSPHSSA